MSVTPVLEARDLTKHFAVHGARRAGAAPPAGPRGGRWPGGARRRRRLARAGQRQRDRGGRRERLGQVHPGQDAGRADQADQRRTAA